MVVRVMLAGLALLVVVPAFAQLTPQDVMDALDDGYSFTDWLGFQWKKLWGDWLGRCIIFVGGGWLAYKGYGVLREVYEGAREAEQEEAAKKEAEGDT